MINVEESAGGLPLKSLPLQLDHVRDIEAFDGPLMSEFRSDTGEVFIYLWCDCDDASSRWIVVRIPKQTLFRYLLADISLRHVIQDSPDGFVYLVDLDQNGEMRQAWYVRTGRLPAEYLPSDDSFYTRGEESQTGYQDIYVGGEGTEAIAIVSTYPKKYQQVYTFNALFRKQARPAAANIPDYRLQGGWSFHTLFRKLGENVPEELRADLVELQAASPGFLRFRVEDAIADGVRDAVARYPVQRQAIRDISKALRRWLKDGRRLREGQVKRLIIELGDILGLDGEALLRANDTLGIVAKTLLSYSRKIAFLSERHAAKSAMMVGVQDHSTGRLAAGCG